jgi:hypothetical protein
MAKWRLIVLDMGATQHQHDDNALLIFTKCPSPGRVALTEHIGFKVDLADISNSVSGPSIGPSQTPPSLAHHRVH